MDDSGNGAALVATAARPPAAEPRLAPGPHRDIVVIGASAGGLEALAQVVGRLPNDLPAAIFVVLHLPAGARSALAAILSRAGPLPAVTAIDGEPIAPGRIYVAPPDRYHLVVEPGRVRLAFGPRENRTRPAADPLFRSAARAYGPRVIGVVLSGTGADGTEGLKAIAAAGGLGVVQDPGEAQFAGMPHVAIRRDAVTYVLPVAEIGPLLVGLVQAPLQTPGDPPDDPPPDPASDPPLAIPGDPEDPILVPVELPLSQLLKRQGEATGLLCPDCGGPLWDVGEDGELRFECRVGHTWSDANSLAESQSVELERQAWGFINALAERAALMERTSAAAAEGEDNLATRAVSVRREATRLAALIVTRLPTVL